jgi:nicotinamide mononucleotide (NMN) deamidase PncC
LDRGIRDEHAVVAPESPTGGAIRQAVLDDQADSGVDDASCVVTARRSKVGHIGVKILAAGQAVVLRVKHNNVAWPLCERVAEVVESAPRQAIAVGTMAATGAGTPAIVAAAKADVWLG